MSEDLQLTKQPKLVVHVWSMDLQKGYKTNPAFRPPLPGTTGLRHSAEEQRQETGDQSAPLQQPGPGEGFGRFGCGSKIGTQNRTLVNGNMDLNLRSSGGLILTHPHLTRNGIACSETSGESPATISSGQHKSPRAPFCRNRSRNKRNEVGSGRRKKATARGDRCAYMSEKLELIQTHEAANNTGRSICFITPFHARKGNATVFPMGGCQDRGSQNNSEGNMLSMWFALKGYRASQNTELHTQNNINDNNHGNSINKY